MANSQASIKLSTDDDQPVVQTEIKSSSLRQKNRRRGKRTLVLQQKSEENEQRMCSIRPVIVGSGFRLDEEVNQDSNGLVPPVRRESSDSRDSADSMVHLFNNIISAAQQDNSWLVSPMHSGLYSPEQNPVCGKNPTVPFVVPMIDDDDNHGVSSTAPKQPLRRDSFEA